MRKEREIQVERKKNKRQKMKGMKKEGKKTKK